MRVKKELITQEYLRKYLNYCYERGVLIWRERDVEEFKTSRDWKAWNTRFANKEAGTITDEGYVAITINGNRFQCHRMIWLWVYGVWPCGEIDHVDGRRSNNKITNLRDVSRSGNAHNQHHANNCNKSKMLGVHLHKSNKKYQSQITINGKTKYLGSFDKPEDAHNAYLTAKRRYHSDTCTI